ncbi:MAG: hypothetical protein ABTQ25_14825 [Nitrosomonas ureae]
MGPHREGVDSEEHETNGRLRPYRVAMDGRWKLEDLYEFPHTFSQCYSFIYCFDSELPARDRGSLNESLSSYPWRGGYSYVNIYSRLYHQIPREYRPVVKSISYASPGWLDILLNVDVALQVAKSVGILAASAVGAAKAYAEINKYINQVSVERKRAQVQAVQLTYEQHKIFMSMSKDMAKFLGFKSVEELHQHTGSPEVSVKLLAAHYRRTLRLTEFSHDGKAVLPESED